MDTRSRVTTVRSALINVMCRAATKAARGLIRDFGEVELLQVSRKGPGDFVSAADHKSEKILHEELSKARPGYSFLMEESGRIEGDNPEYCWIIDPLDGTTNFLHGIPHFCISIGLKKGNELIAGVIYDPIKDEMFWAEKGLGAFVNDRRLRVSNRSKLADSVIATGIPTLAHGKPENFSRRLNALMPQVAGVRRLGAAALDLAYVAAGRFEAYWEDQIAPWDVAAGIVLVREAGGVVTDLSGGQDMLDKRTILSSNMHLHESLGKLLK